MLPRAADRLERLLTILMASTFLAWAHQGLIATHSSHRALNSGWMLTATRSGVKLPLHPVPVPRLSSIFHWFRVRNTGRNFHKHQKVHAKRTPRYACKLLLHFGACNPPTRWRGNAFHDYCSWLLKEIGFHHTGLSVVTTYVIRSNPSADVNQQGPTDIRGPR